MPLHVPIGAKQEVSATIDLLHGTVLKGPKDPIGDLPDGERERVGEYRRQLVEAIVDTNEDLLTRYLDSKEMTYEELRDALHLAVREGKVIPVVASSATKKVGFAGLLSTIVEMLPSPVEGGSVIGLDGTGQEIARKVAVAEKLSALVFKTLADPFVGKLSYVRVFSGTLHHNTQVYDATKKQTERVGQIFFLRGKEQEIVEAVSAGDICAIPKLAASNTNSTLTDKDAPIELPAIKFPDPSFSVAIEPSSKADLDKLGTALHKLIDEDPTLHVRRDDATHETLLSAVGESAIEVAVHHLRDKFGVQVDTRTPRVPYRESIRAKASAQGRYKRQTGGHGQFGDVWLEIEPLPPGSGVVYATRVVGGSVPKNFFPAVEKGVREQAEKGVIAGYPLSDFKATLYDGSYHTVDSSEMSFKIAGSLALQSCVKEAQPYLLEPIVELDVLVPEEQMGDVLSDFNARRGRVLGMESAGSGHQRIKAHVPMAETFRYATELRSMTGGRGSFTSKFLAYEQCPSHIAEKVVAAHETAEEPAAGHSPNDSGAAPRDRSARETTGNLDWGRRSRRMRAEQHSNPARGSHTVTVPTSLMKDAPVEVHVERSRHDRCYRAPAPRRMRRCRYGRWAGCRQAHRQRHQSRPLERQQRHGHVQHHERGHDRPRVRRAEDRPSGGQAAGESGQAGQGPGGRERG